MYPETNTSLIISEYLSYFVSLISQYRYDIWSIGVIFLEVILGTEDVFIISTPNHLEHMLKLDSNNLLDTNMKR